MANAAGIGLGFQSNSSIPSIIMQTIPVVTSSGLADQMCPVNQVVNGSIGGTLVCTPDQTSGGGTAFNTNQLNNNLNTTANVSFTSINMTGIGIISNISFLMGTVQNSTFSYSQGGLVIAGATMNTTGASPSGGLPKGIQRGNIIMTTNASSGVWIQPYGRGTIDIGGSAVNFGIWGGVQGHYTEDDWFSINNYGSISSVSTDAASNWQMNNIVDFLGGLNTTHIISTGVDSINTISIGTGACTGGFDDGSFGDGLNGVLNISAGTSCNLVANAPIATVTFNSGCPSGNLRVTLTPANTNAGDAWSSYSKGGVYVSDTTATSFVVYSPSASGLPHDSVDYTWYYSTECTTP